MGARTGFYPGLIAGMIGGTVAFLYVTLVHKWSNIPDVTTFDFWINYLIYHLGIQGIFGGIFGIIYSRFHNGVPGKGVVKGIVFGIIVALIANISYASHFLLLWSLTGIEKYYQWGLGYAEGFIKWFTYGVVLEPLYKRLPL